MAQKTVPLSLRSLYIKGFAQTWFSDYKYSSLWLKDLKLRFFISTFFKRNLIYKLSNVKSRRMKYKSSFSLAGLWTKFYFKKTKVHSFIHIMPKKGPQSFYTPFYPKKKFIKKPITKKINLLKKNRYK